MKWAMRQMTNEENDAHGRFLMRISRYVRQVYEPVIAKRINDPVEWCSEKKFQEALCLYGSKEAYVLAFSRHAEEEAKA